MCVNKSASTFTIFFFWETGIPVWLEFTIIIDINNSFHRSFYLDLWFESYSKFCEVPLNILVWLQKEPVNISLFWIQLFHMGLNITNQTNLDFVEFLWNTLSVDWSAHVMGQKKKKKKKKTWYR